MHHHICQFPSSPNQKLLSVNHTHAPRITRSDRPTFLMFRAIRLSRCFPRILRQSNRCYSQPAGESPPKVRYLFYTAIFSTGVLWLAASQVDKKKKNSFASESELKAYEEQNGLRLRHKLISGEKAAHYSFYVVPYSHLDSSIDKLAKRLETLGRPVKVVDPNELVQQEMEDESRKYSILLQELTAQKKPFPKGLITALIKQDVENFLNTRNGTFDTNFLIKNFPQTTDEAIKFENDVADVEKCLVLHYDMLNELRRAIGAEAARRVENVVGYFETVDRSKTIVAQPDELDAMLTELMLEDVL